MEKLDSTTTEPGSVFIDATERARLHMRRAERIKACIGPQTYKWARRARPLFNMPYLMGRVWVRGFEHMPLFTEPAPILAFAHKKIHDVCVVTNFLMARPLERFHNLTLVAQGGLFNGIYPWRDLTPAFIQRSFLRRPAAALARLLGRGISFFMRVVNANPVFREGSDLPTTPEAYNHHSFAGELIMGMPHADFVKFANRETRNSVINTQRELVELNRTFVIFPEGIYMHDGAIAETQDLTGVAAFRKRRAVHFISMTYDELCPDRLGRIDAWLDIAPLAGPPTGREDIADFLAAGRKQLQDNSVITASHLIALALNELREREKFTRAELVERFEQLAARTIQSPLLFDPNLAREEYRRDRLKRFLRSRSRWFRRKGNDLYPRRDEMQKFLESERTVDDITWNCNNVRHAADYLTAGA